MFWFFPKLGPAYRLAPGADLATKLMEDARRLPPSLGAYWPGLGGIDLLVGLTAPAGDLLIQSKIKNAKKYRRDAEYGTARWSA